ncbi:protein of unknown function [uncultured Woeseiaceae bacterium]|uniref:Uncharacterized protein n=1 Tax=uncultured Woeseiaceae bacterium TaxID=1983305 RepID=A0A7D9H347_9GAMM|nr:protein of unknown function [uncultured Woeseiaceae bacterium]
MKGVEGAQMGSEKRNKILDQITREKTIRDYDDSVLRNWLKLKFWRADESLCLLCDIDPTGAFISWGFENYTGEIIDTPKLVNAQLLREPIVFYSIPVDPKSPKFGYLKFSPGPGLPDNLPDAGLEIVRRKGEKLQLAQEKLRQITMFFERHPHSQEVDLFSPEYVIDWAVSEGINIPWLDWAESQGLVTTERSELSGGKIKKETDNQKIEQISDLREAAVQMAIKRRVNDGMPKKHITVIKISRWLLESGKFSTGEPFSTRWREAEGIRSLLKGKHNPLSDKRYIDAKPIRSSKFNS